MEAAEMQPMKTEDILKASFESMLPSVGLIGMFAKGQEPSFEKR